MSNTQSESTYTPASPEGPSYPTGLPHRTAMPGESSHPSKTIPLPREMPVNQGVTIIHTRNNKNKKRANIKIASQNLNGAAAPSENMTFLQKWSKISDTIQSEKIAILAVQETHLDEIHTKSLQERYQKNLKIIVSEDPENPRTKAGVAFIINKKLIEPEEIKTYILTPGRAMVLKIKWMKTCDATILNIYAPNERKAHENYWARILTERRFQRVPIPEVFLGDFNVTEDAIDRMPPKSDKEYAITALRDVRHEWNLTDAWRTINPNERAFTYSAQTSTGHIQARLDRIYVAKNIEKHTFDWEIKETAIPSDHSMVTVRYAPKDAPYIGTGRWTLPLHLLNNEDMLEKIAKRGSEAQANCYDPRTCRAPIFYFPRALFPY